MLSPLSHVLHLIVVFNKSLHYLNQIGFYFFSVELLQYFFFSLIACFHYRNLILAVLKLSLLCVPTGILYLTQYFEGFRYPFNCAVMI